MDLRNFVTFVIEQNGRRIGRPYRLTSFGPVTGNQGGVDCFAWVQGISDQGYPSRFAPETFNGPVSIRVRYPDGRKVWFGVASALQLVNDELDRAAADRHVYGGEV